ncbi:MAG: type II toxin-antitoxin system PemK/MazF family toxin, partial [Deltaproteobacteria bacterium]
KSYPTRIKCEFKKKEGWIVLDQLRTIDKTRLVSKLGAIDVPTSRAVISTLHEMFAK